MKLIYSAALLLSLVACNKRPADTQLVEAPEDTGEFAAEVPMASACGTDGKMCQKSEVADGNALSESDLDNSSDAMMAQQAEEQEKDRLLENLNPNANNDLYVFRDKATGCEFVQVENDSYTSSGAKTLVVFPRPNGKGGQRGCGTGTDFKNS